MKAGATRDGAAHLRGWILAASLPLIALLPLASCDAEPGSSSGWGEEPPARDRPEEREITPEPQVSGEKADAGESGPESGAGSRSAPDSPRSPYATARRKMIEDQLKAHGRDIRDQRVLAAMEAVPRHEFVPAAERSRAYGDHPLPIGHGQTISQPFIVAYMTEQLAPEKEHRVLEIGTGSGYQAAVLAELVDTVFTIEIVEELGKHATATLERLGYGNVRTRVGDGYRGWPEEAPFDAIIVTCAPDDIPPALVEQLAEGGRMMIPVGPQGRAQELVLLEKRQGQVEEKRVMSVRFVPMTGGEE